MSSSPAATLPLSPPQGKRRQQSMGQWPLELGIRLHVYLMQTSSPETCRGEATQHTHPRILPGSWQRCLPLHPPPPPHPPTRPQPQLREWEQGNAMCLLSLTPPVLLTWGSKHRKTLFTGSMAWPSPESFLKIQIPQKWILFTGFKVAHSESS